MYCSMKAHLCHLQYYRLNVLSVSPCTTLLIVTGFLAIARPQTKHCTQLASQFNDVSVTVFQSGFRQEAEIVLVI